MAIGGFKDIDEKPSDTKWNENYNRGSLCKGEMNMKSTTLTSPFKLEGMLK